MCKTIIFLEWERVRGKGGERNRERETENPKQAPCLMHEPSVGLDLTTLRSMTWAEIKSQMLSWLNHPDTLGISTSFEYVLELLPNASSLIQKLGDFSWAFFVVVVNKAKFKKKKKTQQNSAQVKIALHLGTCQSIFY